MGELDDLGKGNYERNHKAYRMSTIWTMLGLIAGVLLVIILLEWFGW